MATTPATIYGEILTKVRSTASESSYSLASSRVQLSPVFSPDGLTTPFIQIIVPGEGSIPHALGGVGLVVEEFEIAVIEQILRDRFNTYTDAISHATNSLMALVTAIRGDGLATGSSGLHNHVSSNSEGPVFLTGWGAIRQMEEDPNFLAHVDRYTIRYELASYS